MYLNLCYFRGESRSPDDGRRLASRTLHSLCYSLLPDFDIPFWNILSNLIGHYKIEIINVTELGMLAKGWQGGQCYDIHSYKLYMHACNNYIIYY